MISRRGQRLTCCGLGLAIALHLGGIRVANAEEALELEQVINQGWYEITESKDKLLGSTFRVFVNEGSLAWLRGKAKHGFDLVIVKLNVTENADSPDRFEHARVEMMRGQSSSEPIEWQFYGFGTVGDVSRTGKPLPSHSCFTCHANHKWRSEPVFFDLYLDETTDFQKVSFQLQKQSGYKSRLEISKQ